MLDTIQAPATLSSLPLIKRPPNPPAAARPATPKLSALTSLRFFAAAMIVLFHSQSYFGAIPVLARFTLTQGVTFFFVLSGFILTYAYPALDRNGVKRFLVARIARILPLHLVALLLYVLILPAWYRDSVSENSRVAGALTITLTQAWVPVRRIQSAFNGVSWSLSVELFFYLCFPLLLWHWRRTWRVKIAASLLLVAGAILIANHGMGQLPAGADVADIVYFHPLARVCEFTIGVAAAHLWQFLRTRVHCGRWLGTALEVAALVVTLVVMALSGGWARAAGHVALIGPGGEAWLASSGFVFLPFAALIGVMAFEWGWVSRALACRPLVFLGEISFSLYLLHLIVCHYYVIHPGAFVSVPPWLLYLGYWLIVLLASFVGWSAVEVPCRRAIVGWWDRYVARRDVARRAIPRVPRRRSGRQFSGRSWSAAASGALVVVVATLHLATRSPLPAPATLNGIARADARATVAVDAIGDRSTVGDMPVVLARRDYESNAMTVIGWSVDTTEHRPVRGVLVSVDDSAGSWAEYGSSRNDVSTRLGSSDFLHSGYIGVISLRDLANGPHTLTIKALIPGENAYAETRESFILT
jgi:peptidoglycan/LPS O-acetylase OafA/YrhL